MKSQNWFQSHLNANAISSILLGFIFAGLGSLDALEEMSIGLGALIFHFTDWLDTRELTFVLIGLAVCLPVLVWTLRQKKRSPWWVLIAFIPFGWIGFLFLGNSEMNRAKERVEKLRDEIKLHDYLYFVEDSPEISDADYDKLKNEMKGLEEQWPQLLQDKQLGNFWRRVRQVLCSAGIAAIIVFMVMAARYDLPVTGGYWDLIEYDYGGVDWVWTEIKDYSNAPFWVKLGSEHGIITVVVGIFLLYGALRKT